MPHLSTALAVAALLTSVGPAQTPRSTTSPVPLTGIWRIPIHTMAADPTFGEYGTWASGDNYKVSFHDGFVFHPVPGGDYRERPTFRWTTRSVHVADIEWLDDSAAPTPHHNDWRYEYRFPGITEAYDVLPHGVEQTFIVHDRVALAGDLVVRGTVTTDLTAPRQTAGHGALVFADRNGIEVLTYGEAFVFDASGRRTAVSTTFDGETIALTVPGDWLADAVYPVTIDPLTTPKIFSRDTTTDVDICRNGELGQLLILATRLSGTDVAAIRTTDTFDDPVWIYSDLAARRTTEPAQGCYNGLANRWALCLGRSETMSRVRVYLHDQDDSTINSGTTLYLSPPPGFEDSVPSIGGTGAHVGNPLVYLAWQRDRTVGGQATSRIYGAAINVAGSGGFQATTLLSPGTGSLDSERPSVSRQSLGGDWVITWQEYDNLIVDDWDIRACRVSNGGVVRGTATIGPPTTHRHKLFPQVAGAAGRFLFSFIEADKDPGNSKTHSGRGQALAVQRGDWSGTGALVTDAVRYVPITTSVSTFARSLAYDSNTDSHWALGYSDEDHGKVARLGRTGCVLEVIDMPALPDTALRTGPSIAFDDDASTFALASVFGGAFFTGLYGTHLSHPPDAICTSYGTGCSGTMECRNGVDAIGNTHGLQQPFAGSEFFALRLDGAVPNQSYVLYVAAGPDNRPLSPGCSLNLDATFFPIRVGTTSSSGRYDLALSLPDCGRVRGDLYWQWFTYHDSRIKSSRAMKTEIR